VTLATWEGNLTRGRAATESLIPRRLWGHHAGQFPLRLRGRSRPTGAAQYGTKHKWADPTDYKLFVTCRLARSRRRKKKKILMLFKVVSRVPRAWLPRARRRSRSTGPRPEYNEVSNSKAT